MAKKIYDATEIPEWIKPSTPVDRLIKHIKFMTHTLATERRARNSYRAKLYKLRKQTAALLAIIDNNEVTFESYDELKETKAYQKLKEKGSLK